MEARPHWLWFCYTSGKGEGLRAAVAGGGEGWGVRRWLVEHMGPQELRAAPLASSLTAWHDYRLAWLEGRVLCQVDGRTVLEAARAPSAPLALVLWMGNNRLGAGGPGHRAIARPQWLEVEYLSLAQG